MGVDLQIRSLSYQDIPQMLDAFKQSFANYGISAFFDREKFEKKFVEKLDMNFDLSGGAFYKNQLVGFIFTSTDIFNGLKTAYNGGTGVIPKFRGNHVTQRIYEYLFPLFKKENVEQCVLEVITNNLTAKNVYEKIGFRKSRLFRCFKLIPPNFLSSKSANNAVSIKLCKEPQWNIYDQFKEIKPAFLDQNNILAKNMKNEKLIELIYHKQCVGYAIYQPGEGRISQFAIDPNYRRQGLGSFLINHIYHDLDNKILSILNIDDKAKATIRFLKNIGFSNEINQNEMILKI